MVRGAVQKDSQLSLFLPAGAVNDWRTDRGTVWRALIRVHPGNAWRDASPASEQETSRAELASAGNLRSIVLKRPATDLQSDVGAGRAAERRGAHPGDTGRGVLLRAGRL